MQPLHCQSPRQVMPTGDTNPKPALGDSKGGEICIHTGIVVCPRKVRHSINGCPFRKQRLHWSVLQQVKIAGLELLKEGS